MSTQPYSQESLKPRKINTIRMQQITNNLFSLTASRELRLTSEGSLGKQYLDFRFGIVSNLYVKIIAARWNKRILKLVRVTWH